MSTYKQIFQNELNNIEKNGLLKRERALKPLRELKLLLKIIKQPTICAQIIIWV